MNNLAYKVSEQSPVSAHDKLILCAIAEKMLSQNLSEEFVANAIQVGMEFEGVADLIMLWDEEDDIKEREEVIADIQDLITDCTQVDQTELPCVRFNDLDAIANDIRAFKDGLLQIVDEYGGISKLANETGIPQPSLSRFFNSDSMPRRTTLLKIAKALKIDVVRVATPWSY